MKSISFIFILFIHLSLTSCSIYHLTSQYTQDNSHKSSISANNTQMTSHQTHPHSIEAIFNKHQQQRRLDSCGDTTADPCHACIDQWGAKYCRYTKAFKMYKCCPAGETEGICSSKDPDVVCTDQLPGLLKYQVCYRDSLQCGSEIVFIVNSTMETQTTEFFTTGGVCFYRLRTYEDDDQVNINVTFTNITGSEAYLIYKKNGQQDYREEKVQIAQGENLTYTFVRGDLQDKDLYIVTKATSQTPLSSKVIFTAIRTDIPEEIPDNSFIAKIAISAVIVSIFVIAVVKTFETLEHNAMIDRKMVLQNMQFENRLGIDFDIDRVRLQALALSTKRKFNTSCLKHNQLFRN